MTDMSWHCGDRTSPTHSDPEHTCPNWDLAPIRDRVGVAGKNNAADVRVIRGALNRVIGSAATLPRLETTTEASRELIDAIRRFQRFALGAGSVNGYIRPKGQTYRALSKELHMKRIVVSLKDQILEALQDGRRVFRFECVTGDGAHPTTPGTFKVFRKRDEHRSSIYGTQMNYAMTFSHDGKAIHQYHGVSGLTAVRLLKHNMGVDFFGSHGCVRLAEADARTLFHWTPMGAAVYIY